MTYSRYVAVPGSLARSMAVEMGKNFVEAGTIILEDEITNLIRRSHPNGRLYRIPGTKAQKKRPKGKKRKKGEIIGIRGANLYRASAPGQAPAERLGIYLAGFARTPPVQTAKGVTAQVFNATKVGKNHDSLGAILENGHRRGRTRRRPHWGVAMDLAAPKIAKLAKQLSTKRR